MPETFLILLAGGIMLAAGVSDPKQVTLRWLRLCGILALAMAGLAMFFMSRQPQAVGAVMWMANVIIVVVILAQLALVQTAHRAAQQALAWLAFLLAIRIGADHMRSAIMAKSPSIGDELIYYASAIGIAAMCGLALMDMLLGHAYLTASSMTMAPFRRLNGFLAGVVVWRAIVAAGATMAIDHFRPVYMLWGAQGLFILTRWLVGLAVPGVFVYMAHDCIKRRATQSATGILYVAGVLIFIGELLALYLVRATGLPF